MRYFLAVAATTAALSGCALVSKTHLPEQLVSGPELARYQAAGRFDEWTLYVRPLFWTVGERTASDLVARAMARNSCDAIADYELDYQDFAIPGLTWILDVPYLRVRGKCLRLKDGHHPAATPVQ